MHIFRWDLDKTYLDTDIHSVRGMLRSALESAADKRTVPGADALLRGLLARDPDARLSIVSGSPRQMRSVLEEKLALDGIRVDSLVLKDNLRNIRRGRFRAVRGQVGYKLPQLLAARLSEPGAATESLFGDDAEVDALIYAIYADAVAGRLGSEEVASLMGAGGAYDDQIAHALRSLERLPRADAVRDIWIHVDRGVPLAAFDLLGPLVHVVFSWFQAALALWARERLHPDAVAAVARRVESERGLGPRGLAALAQDAVRRGLVEADDLPNLFRDSPALAPLAEPVLGAVRLLGPHRMSRRTEDADHARFLDAMTALHG